MQKHFGDKPFIYKRIIVSFIHSELILLLLTQSKQNQILYHVSFIKILKIRSFET